MQIQTYWTYKHPTRELKKNYLQERKYQQQRYYLDKKGLLPN